MLESHACKLSPAWYERIKSTVVKTLICVFVSFSSTSQLLGDHKSETNACSALLTLL